MGNKSVVTEGKQIQLAIELVKLGARLQVLETETGLSRERLLRLYKEVKGVSPPKGMLPFSDDWYLSWLPNIHSSLFIDIHRYLCQHTDASGVDALIKAYKLYIEHIKTHGLEEVLSLTRAWILLRFFKAQILKTASCSKCSGHFIVHAMELHKHYVCGLCHAPSRAGKTKKAKLAKVSNLVSV